jgi:hypothetical protein
VGTEEAMAWLREVEGRLYRSGPDASGRSAWVAVVRTPGRTTGARGKLIIALGETLEAAAASAEEQWRKLWSALGPVH